MALSTAAIYVAAEMKHWHESMVFGEPFIHSSLVRRPNYRKLLLVLIYLCLSNTSHHLHVLFSLWHHLSTSIGVIY
jgi:hypothetical protein